MTYNHGIYSSEVPTTVSPPVSSFAGLPVVFGTAPVHLATEPVAVNEPVLCYTYEEAVKKLGYSDDWDNYTLCEVMYSHFKLFAMAPIVFANVLDSATHKQSVAAENQTLANDQAKLTNKGVLKASVVVKSQDELTTYTLNTDYLISYNDDEEAVISRVSTGTIAADATLAIDYDYLDPSAVTATDVIGGIDGTTGAYEGLELLNKIFPLFSLVPGMVLAPGWSDDATVAAVMTAKASNINGLFKCIALTDVPTGTVKKYTDVLTFKNDNNYTDEQQAVCWPLVKMDDKVFHLSTQLAGLLCLTDSSYDDVPYVSPSNKSLKCNGAVLKDLTVVSLGPDQASYLNGQGIITAMNFVGGWKLWGNRTGAYPTNTDPKDSFLAVRRMFNWVSNTLTLMFWDKVDNPLTKRLIDSIVDSSNIWLNGLTAREMLLGGRVEFLADENPDTDLIDGKVKLHVYLTPPSPAREFDFIVEYDSSYVESFTAE